MKGAEMQSYNFIPSQEGISVPRGYRLGSRLLLVLSWCLLRAGAQAACCVRPEDAQPCV